MGQGTPAELEAATLLHHQFFTGLILGMAGHHGQALAAELVHRTFRRQHDERFVRGIGLLGLGDLPAAVACARFICLSNRAGGLDVHYHEEGPRKAWVRYPPPRWAYQGPAICALDNGVTEAFLRGFHARCGPSLGNPRLRFVCTGMTTNGDAGLSGYFEELDAPVAADGRLVLRLGEALPDFDGDDGLALPWDDARQAVARRNYAVRYIQVMLPVTLELLGRDQGVAFAGLMARLVGLQAWRDVAVLLEVTDGVAGFVDALAAVNRGTGNTLAACEPRAGRLALAGCRLGEDPALFECWSGLWRGALAMHAPGLALRCTPEPGWQVG